MFSTTHSSWDMMSNIKLLLNSWINSQFVCVCFLCGRIFSFSLLYHLEKQMYPIWIFLAIREQNIYEIVNQSNNNYIPHLFHCMYLICNIIIILIMWMYENIFKRSIKHKKIIYFIRMLSCLVDGMCACIFCSYPIF